MQLHRGRRRHRAGYALVLFVMIVFGLMGLAALVIDMGFARLAQRQMQTAVDSAALEGLRWQAASATDPSVPDPRQQASQVVADLFTDYVDSGAAVQYGAGPVVNFTGGVGPADMAAGQTIVIPNPPVYQPKRADGTPGLELNPSNAAAGDMVAGTYNPGQPSAEADDYARADFTPATSGSSTGNAFLVRMRRTNNTNGLDQEPGVSSGGPTLPLLFGRGSLMARSGGNGQLSVASGITVRATAIAGAGTARTVGRPNAAASLPGSLSAQIPPNTTNGQLYYVVFYLSQWSPSSAITFIVSTDGTGSIQSSDRKTTYGYVADGSVVDTSDVSTVYPNGRPLLGPAAMVGAQAIQIAVDPSALTTELLNEISPTGVAYIPIVDDTGDTESNPLFLRVVGFGYVSGVKPNGTNGFSLTTGGTLAVASQNASATLGVALPKWFTDPTLGSARTNQLFTGNSAGANLMLAPVLVNHYIGPQ
jgi:Flp pilus assembly protein TadG